jgi:hypothetical protein
MFVDGEPLDRDKLNQVANNMQWLYENTPRIAYRAFGVNKSNGAKILAGVGTARYTLSSLSYATVYFGSFFSQGCQPIVTAVPIQNGDGRTRYETVVRGIGRNQPDHRGCQIGITTDEYTQSKNHHPHSLTVNWIAIGW